MTPTPEAMTKSWAVLHAADGCDHAACGAPAGNADQECLARRVALALTEHAREIERLRMELAKERANG